MGVADRGEVTIRILGNQKSLHRLAVEDLIHTTNRTKVDRYSDHAYIVLTLQKLINLEEEESHSSNSEEESGKKQAPWNSARRASTASSKTAYKGNPYLSASNSHSVHPTNENLRRTKEVTAQSHGAYWS
uniref:Uncharacterized protein n=1 Tax=Coccidioides posadasii RMSCC 3488 TaxID=454284 RepID=A0A0J6FLA8_COCPO|nr:hypothetical protein CPAG_07405 [Coccidioides posadasii RMSCC 3488]